MPQSHGRQKHLARQKKRRELAKARQRSVDTGFPRSAAKLVRAAAQLPYGPAFATSGWRSTDGSVPPLVTVIVTRRSPGDILIPGVALVDRTCLGVKHGYVARPIDALALPELLDRVTGGNVDIEWEECDVLVAQSIVFHAIDYARSLGFAPHRDFPEPIFGPRPERLLDTPLARPDRPNFVAGPSDDVKAIFARLRTVVGAGNFDFLFGDVPLSQDEQEEDDDELEFEEDDDNSVKSGA